MGLTIIAMVAREAIYAMHAMKAKSRESLAWVAPRERIEILGLGSGWGLGLATVSSLEINACMCIFIAGSLEL